MAAYLAEDGTAELGARPRPQPDIDADDVRRARSEFAEPGHVRRRSPSASASPRWSSSRGSTHGRCGLVAEDGALVPRAAPQGAGPAARRARARGRCRAGRRRGPAAGRQAAGDPGQARRQRSTRPRWTRRSSTWWSGPRASGSMEVPAEVVEPEFTTEDAEALGIKEQVSEFTTYFPYAEYRNTNIGRAAELVDGTIVAPGETFSLNGTVGERTAENGFTKGFIISNGIFKEDLGGGVSQMATTTFNAAFFGGHDRRRAQAALLLHRPLPRRPRGDRGLADRRPAVPQRHAVRRPGPRPRHAEHPVGAGRGDRAALLHEVLGHHDQDRRALQLHLPRDPDPRHRGLLPEHRATAASTSTSGATGGGPAPTSSSAPRRCTPPTSPRTR